jgi:hypothetical protein
MTSLEAILFPQSDPVVERKPPTAPTPLQLQVGELQRELLVLLKGDRRKAGNWHAHAGVLGHMHLGPGGIERRAPLSNHLGRICELRRQIHDIDPQACLYLKKWGGPNPCE